MDENAYTVFESILTTACLTLSRKDHLAYYHDLHCNSATLQSTRVIKSFRHKGLSGSLRQASNAACRLTSPTVSEDSWTR